MLSYLKSSFEYDEVPLSECPVAATKFHLRTGHFFSSRKQKSSKLSVLNSYSLDPFRADQFITRFHGDPERLFHFRNVTVFGDSFLSSAGSPIAFEGLIPGYLVARIKSAGFHKDKFERQLKATEKVEFYDDLFLISHSHSSVYGHFLTECFPRIFTISKFYELGYRIPVYVGSSEPPYIKDFLNLVIPGVIIVSPDVDTMLHCRNLYVPGFYRFSVYPDRVIDQIDEFSSRFPGQTKNLNSSDRIFISRSSANSRTAFRSFDNQIEIEELVAGLGYSVIKPERFSLEEQIALFRNASVVVGEYGSGMHNAIFSRRNTIVVSLNWINLVQQSLGRNFGHDNIFILPEGGRPILAPDLGGKGRQSFRVSSDLVESTICNL